MRFIGDTAYLKGTVKREMERHRAELAAHSLPEVKPIFNRIWMDRASHLRVAQEEFDQAEEYLEEKARFGMLLVEVSTFLNSETR